MTIEDQEPVEQTDDEEEVADDLDDLDSWLSGSDDDEEQADESEADDEKESLEPDEFRSEFAAEAGIEDPAAEPDESDSGVGDEDIDLLIAARTDGIDEMSQAEAEEELQRQRVEQFAKEALAYAKQQKAEAEAKAAAAAKALSSDAQPTEEAYEPTVWETMSDEEFEKVLIARSEGWDRIPVDHGVGPEVVADTFNSLVSAPRFPDDEDE